MPLAALEEMEVMILYFTIVQGNSVVVNNIEADYLIKGFNHFFRSFEP